MTNKQVLINMQKHVGREVIILKGIHTNKKGKAIKAYIPQGKKKPAMHIELDNGGTVDIENATHLFFILSQIRADKVNQN